MKFTMLCLLMLTNTSLLASSLKLDPQEGVILNYTSANLDEFSISVEWTCENGWGAPIKEGKVDATISMDGHFFIPGIKEKCWSFSGTQFYTSLNIIHESGIRLLKNEGYYSPSMYEKISLVEIAESTFYFDHPIDHPQDYDAVINISTVAKFPDQFYSILEYSTELQGKIEEKTIYFPSAFMAIPTTNMDSEGINFTFDLVLSDVSDHYPRILFSNHEYNFIFDGEIIDLPLSRVIHGIQQ